MYIYTYTYSYICIEDKSASIPTTSPAWHLPKAVAALHGRQRPRQTWGRLWRHVNHRGFALYKDGRIMNT